MIFMNNLANYISSSRIILSILLLFTEPLSIYFFIIFIICGISDILDGYIAKNYGFSSDFGANLDSFADVIFFLSFLIVLLPILNLSYFMVLWIMIIFLIKIMSIYIGFIKFSKFSLIHSYLNKLTGIYLILLPFLLLLSSSKLILVVLYLIATIASLEELIIIIHTHNINLNHKTFDL